MERSQKGIDPDIVFVKISVSMINRKDKLALHTIIVFIELRLVSRIFLIKWRNVAIFIFIFNQRETADEKSL
jgi:hypothetical protein